MVVFDGELTAWRRGEADIDHVASDRLKRRDDDAVKHGPRNARVAPDDDRTGLGLTRGPCAESGGEPRDDLWGQCLAHTSAHSGNADHQPFVHAPLPVQSPRKLQMAMSWTKHALRVRRAERSMSAGST